MAAPASLEAGKNKADTPPPANLGEQRQERISTSQNRLAQSTRHPRVAFQRLFTGQKIDPDLYVKKGHKQTWMDRLAGTQSNDEVKMENLPFQLIRTYGVAVDSKGLIYAADQAVGAIFIFDCARMRLR